MDLQKNEYTHAFPKPLLVIAGPSGAGKTTLIKEMNKVYDDYIMAISDTTKPQNLEKDINGVDYNFITQELFIQREAQKKYVEHNAYMGANFYGTPWSELERILRAGKTPALDIDINGLIQVDSQFPRQRTFRLFLDVDEAEQERRLVCRARDTPESIRKRIKFAHDERALFHKLEKDKKGLIDLYINNTNLRAFESVSIVMNHLRGREQLLNVAL